MDIPEWADSQLSIDLPMLRSRGESQDLEYMQKFPDNVRELSKEIAAFSTSNGGTILIGISNSGDLAGIDAAQSSEGRDELLRRLEGICSGTVRPTITPTAKYAVESEKVVMCIIVPNGNQPVYYSHNVPYIRHLTQSRPAEPHEVIEIMKAYFNISREANESIEKEPKDTFYTDLARVFIDVLIYSEEADERGTNPWLEIMKTKYLDSALALIELSEKETAKTENLKDQITEVADLLEKIGNFRMYIGCWAEFRALIKQVTDMIQNIMKSQINTIPLDSEAIEQAKHHIYDSTRKLNGLVARIDKLIEYGRIEELIREASQIGKTLLRLSYYNIASIGEDIQNDISLVARRLHIFETAHLRPDGGASLNSLIEELKDCNMKLVSISDQLSGQDP